MEHIPHHLYKLAALGYVAIICPVLGLSSWSNRHGEHLFFKYLGVKVSKMWCPQAKIDFSVCVVGLR